jgi:hypothetical protein
MTMLRTDAGGAASTLERASVAAPSAGMTWDMIVSFDVEAVKRG